MLILGQKKEPQRIVLRAAVPPVKAVRKGRKIVTPAQDGEPEAFVVMAPITSAMRRRAFRVTQRELGGEPLSDVDIDRMIDIGELGSRELIRVAMIEWGGIGGPDGEPLDLTPDAETRFATANAPDRPKGTIDLLLADEESVATIDEEYVRKDAARLSEKNALSASPSGTGVAATPVPITAASPAASVRKKPKRSGAKSVRTRSTRSRAKPAKASGKR